MESLYRTPLLDCFRRGEVAPDIRMLAAQGVLAPRAHEQLGLLVLLSNDADPAIRAATEATIARIPTPTWRASSAGRTWHTRFATSSRAAGSNPSSRTSRSRTSRCSTSRRHRHEGAPEPDGSDAGSGEEGEAGEARRLATIQRLALMTVSEKIKAAMRGSREERTILIRDPNKLVSLAVLSSPKVNEREIESYAKMANVSEDVLRVIGTTRAWTKSYSVVRSLAFNPKAPIAVSLTLVSRLVEKDVRMISMDRNIAEPVRILARKALQAGKSRRG